MDRRDGGAISCFLAVGAHDAITIGGRIYAAIGINEVRAVL
jgi:hypothetical protein